MQEQKQKNNMEKLKLFTKEEHVRRDKENTNNIANSRNNVLQLLRKYGIDYIIGCADDLTEIAKHPERAEREYKKVQLKKLEGLPTFLQEQGREEMQCVWDELIEPDITSCTIQSEFVKFDNGTFIVDDDAILEANTRYLTAPEEIAIYNELDAICKRLTELSGKEAEGENIIGSGISKDTYRQVFWVNKYIDFASLTKR